METFSRSKRGLCMAAEAKVRERGRCCGQG